MKSLYILIVFLLVGGSQLLCTTAYGKDDQHRRSGLKAETIPCVEELAKGKRPKRGERRRLVRIGKTRWLVSKEEKCLQLNKAGAQALAQLKLEYVGLKKSNESLELEVKKSQAAVKLYRDERVPSLKAQAVLYKSNADASSRQALLWKGKYEELSKRQTPWYMHPAFVATVSVAATVGVISLGAYAFSQVK